MLYPRCYFSDEFDSFVPLFRRLGAQEVSFPRNAYLKSPTGYLQYCYLILSGICNVTVKHDSGYERCIGFWGQGSIYPLIVNENHFFLENTITVKAMTDITALQLSTLHMKQAMAEEPEVAYASLDHYAAYVNMLKFETTAEAFEDAPTRVCNVLYMLYESGILNMVKPKQSELASIAGIRRESMVKALRDLKSGGIISTSSAGIEILDPDELLTRCSSMMQ